MEKKEISMIVERAKNEFGTSKLALLIGIHSNHVNSVIRGNQALPLPSALRLAELLEADPLTIICANAALMEKNQDKKKYLESHILPLEISRIISAYGNKINSVDHTINLIGCQRISSIDVEKKFCRARMAWKKGEKRSRVGAAFFLHLGF